MTGRPEIPPPFASDAPTVATPPGNLPTLRGGAGRLLAARDPDTGREVAIQVVRPGGAADPVLAERFLAEPGFFAPWLGRADLAWRRGERERAWADFDQAVRLGPRESQAWLARALARRTWGDLAEARADLDRVIELSPRNAYAWFHRAVTCEMLRQPQEALPDHGKAIEHDPRWAIPRVNRGALFLGLGKVEGALADFRAALA